MKQVQRSIKEKKESGTPDTVERQSFYEVEDHSSGTRVRLEVTETSLEKKVTETAEGRKIEIDDSEDIREVSFPGVNERYSKLATDVEPEFKVMIPVQEHGEVDIHPVVSGYFFTQPVVEPRKKFRPMNGSFNQKREDTFIPEISLLEPDDPPSRQRSTISDDITFQDYFSSGEKYPEPEPELDIQGILYEHDDSLHLEEDHEMYLIKLQETGYGDVAVEPDQETRPGVGEIDSILEEKNTGDEMGYAELMVTETVGQRADTLEEALDYIFDVGLLDGKIMETPYYSESSGENFQEGWNSSPQVVELEGMDMDFVEYSVNGELARDDIGNVEISEGDRIRLEADEVYDSHGEYAPSEDTYRAWSQRYGEVVWGNEWDSMDRQIYAGIMDGEDPGDIDFSGREHVLEALEAQSEYVSGLDFDMYTGKDQAAS